MNISKVNINTLKCAEYNPRIELKPGMVEYEKLKKSIQEFGYVEPIIVNDRTGLIIGGHQRLTVLKDLGYEEVDVVHVDLDSEYEKALNIALNKISGDWDADKLEDLLRDIDLNTNLDIEFTGFSRDEVDTLFGKVDLDIDKNKDDSINNDTDDYDSNTDDEDDDTDDNIQECIKVSKLQKLYGLPYQGSKSRIADIIINVLPEGERLVDLFGGGGAITHCGILYNKWNKYLYNDINPLITQFFIDAIHGKYKDENRVITKEQFDELKNTDPYVKYIWSFGNDGRSYLWSKELEPIKCQACRVILAGNIHDRRIEYTKLIDMLKQDNNNNIKLHTFDKLTSLERLQRLKNLQSLEKFKKLQSLERLDRLQNLELPELSERLQVSNIDYKDYKYEEGDIVYCDVPYESIRNNTKSCDDYGEKFNSLDFYKWVHSQPYQVFFSSYEISDNTFYKVKVAEVQRLMGHNSDKDTEYLYSNKPIIIEGGTDGET